MSNEIEQNNELSSQSFRVFVRIRPLSEKELNLIDKLYTNVKTKHFQKNILVKEDNLLFVIDPDCLDYNGRKERSFAFDDIYPENVNNQFIFESCIKQNVDNVLNGYNSTVFAYGITGTGKTHTIFGDLQRYMDFNSYEESLKSKDEMGICVYAVDYLFSKIESSLEKNFNIKISYLEIYNEQVIDLLDDKSSNHLMIVEDINKGILVPDLSEFNVKSSRELISLIMKGNSKRTMAPTGENQFSSRSHAILQIVIEQKTKVRDTREEILMSKFLLVDLAGSERSGLEKGIRTHEGKNINKSLLSLGNCINILSDKSKKGAFVPYRDSKLTRLLKDSLAGNIMSVMIACVSPSPTCYDETVNTLKYALKARKIEKVLHKNTKEVEVHISQYKDIIDSLKSEIEQLKQVIKKQQGNVNFIASGNQLNASYNFNNLDNNQNDNNSNFNNANRSSSDNEQDRALGNIGSGLKDNNYKNLMGKKMNYNINNQNNNFFKTSGNENKDGYNNNKNSNTIKNTQMKNGININTGSSLEISSIKKHSFDNKKKILSENFSKENTIEGSNLIMFSNNASLLSSQNVNNNIGKINSISNNINRSNGRANSSVSRNNNTYIAKENSNISNISGNNQGLGFQNTLGVNNNSISKQNVHNNTGGKSPLTYNYAKSNAKKSRRYSDLCRNNINNSNLVSSFAVNDKDRTNTASISPENSIQFNKNHKEAYNGSDNYVNYRRFTAKNGEDEYDIDEFARNVDSLYNDKITFEEIIDKGSTDRVVCEKYKLIKDCYEKYLEIINDKLVENIEHSMVLKINIKEILDLNLINNNNVTNLNKELYTLEKQKIDNPSKASEIDSELNRIREEIKNIQIAIEENDKTKDKISESLLKNENNKKALKQILLKLISNSYPKNELSEETYRSTIKDKEEFEKKANTNEKYNKNGMRDKDVKDNKLGEVLSEVDQLRKLLEEKERKIKEISQLQNNQNRINEYADRDKIIAENITEEDISIRQSELKNLNKELDDLTYEKNNNKYGKQNKNSHVNPITRKDSITEEINSIRNNLNNEGVNQIRLNQNNNLPNNVLSLKESKRNMLSNNTNNNNNNNNPHSNSGNMNKIIYANPKLKNSKPTSVDNRNPYNLKPQTNSGHTSSKNNSNNLNNYNSKNILHMQNIKMNPMQSDKIKKNNLNNIPNSNLIINNPNNLDLNNQDERERNYNFIPNANNPKPRNQVSSVSRSPRNRIPNKDNKDRDLNAIVNASKNKFKEFDKIIQSQLIDVGNNMIYRKPKDLNAKNRKKFKNHSTDNTNAKMGSKKFPFFNHNGIFKYKNPNRIIKIESANKLSVDNMNVNHSINFSSAEEDENENLDVRRLHNLNNPVNNNYEEPPSELDILQNLDRNFENPYKKPSSVNNNKNINFHPQNKKEVGEPNKNLGITDVNNIFLNNYEGNNSKNNPNNPPINEFGIDRNLLEISEIFSSNHDRNKNNYNNERVSNKKISNIISSNLNDDLTLILSPKGVEGISTYGNSSNIEFKSSLFIEKNKQKSYTPDNINNRVNNFENNNNNYNNLNFVNSNNTSQQQKQINRFGANTNNLLNSYENQGFKDNLNSNLNTNQSNFQNNPRLNNINVQKFINKAGNSFNNKNNNLNSGNTNIFMDNLYLNENQKLNQNNNTFNLNEVSTSKFINVPNNPGENQDALYNLNNKNPAFHLYHKKLESSANHYEFSKNYINQPNKNNLLKNSYNQSELNKDFNFNNAKQVARDPNESNPNPSANQNKNIPRNLNLNDFKITPNKDRDFPYENVNNNNNPFLQKAEIENEAKTANIDKHKNLKDKSKSKSKSNSSDTDLKYVKFPELYNYDNLGQIANSEQGNKGVVNSNKSNDKQISLLKQARLERQTHKRSESCGTNNNNTDVIGYVKESLIKQNNSGAASQENRDNSPGTFNSIMESNNMETKGFNKNTVEFFNDYKKNKMSKSNFRTGEIHSTNTNNNFISYNNTNNYNYNEKDHSELNSINTISNHNHMHFNNSNPNYDISYNHSENNYNNSNTNTTNQPNKFGSNFVSNNFDNRKNHSNQMTISNEMSSNQIKKNMGTANNKNFVLDVVDEKSYDVIDEDKMTIEEDTQRNVVNSKNPKLINSFDKK